MVWCLAPLALSISALLSVVAADLLGHPKQPDIGFTISKEITVITAPLRPDGFPDYLAALNERYGKGVTPDNNAAVLIWRAVGPKDVKEELRPEFFRRLGIEPLPVDGTYFIAEHDYVEELLRKGPLTTLRPFSIRRPGGKRTGDTDKFLHSSKRWASCPGRLPRARRPPSG